ncbi:MAG: DUF1127 domain-containing protein, partial [Alphaproteobacteria bacterium]
MRNTTYSPAAGAGLLTPLRPSLLGAVFAALAAAWRSRVRAAAERRQAREAVRQLMAMSNRELKDMGISRSEILA